MKHKRYHEIISGQDQSKRGKTLRLSLSLSAAAYRPLIALRNKLYDFGLRKAHHLARPALSVGNLTAGGTGKTPIVTYIARRLITMGHRPAILLRGYNAHQGLSDEAQLLADALSPDASVHINASRRHAAHKALCDQPDIDCFVLDDAFQHRQARRDLDLVLIDATNPFGHGRMLPRGLLREPLGSLRRAQGLVITRADLVAPDDLTALEKKLNHAAKQPVMGKAAFVWDGYLDADNQPVTLEQLRGRQVLGVCGVGNPGAFEKMLCAQLGQQSVAAMGDHHIYRHEELTELFLIATRQGADALVTTEKDWVKWRQFAPPIGWPLPVYRPRLGVQWLEGEDNLQQMLQTLF